ncbi:MAG: leucine-rich repeat domain-containing protein [Candidatus Lokiarchaeota archaeon]|nr:leucine-rich repeat domain-containing protein [Candidatus Lokiarchaeota archaeon]
MIVIEELKEYNGISLISSEAEFLEQIEKLIGETIPCREDRDETKRKIAESYQTYQPHATQMNAQSILNSQAQTIKTQTTEQERLAQLSIDELEKTYESQYMAQVNPTMQANIQAQLNSLIPMLGENHPSVQQMKAILDMDEDKAKQKGKAMAKFMQQNFKLQSINKEETRRINEVMYSQISLEELEKESLNYYRSMITPEYQAQLKVTLDVGIQELGANDPTFAGLKPLLGMSEEIAIQSAKQYAQSVHQNIQNMLAQYGVQMQTAQQTQKDNMQQHIQQVSEQPVNVSHFGYICDNKHIVGLNLVMKELDLLPDSIGNLSNLRYLALKWNKLEALPETFGNLKELEEFDLDGDWSTNDDKPLYNEISELPNSFCELKKLKIFKCEANGLRNLPENFGQLASLTEVNFQQNHLPKIPESIGELSNLTHLNLKSNRISTIPFSLCRLEKLKQLDLSFNNIEKVPECIEKLKSLNMLLLNNNKLTEIPDTITNLESLDTLWIDSNQLIELPEIITKLKLTKLGISDNQLKNLPYFIYTMESLRDLKVTGNPFTEEEQEIAHRDTNAIFEYCRQRASIAVMLIHTESDAEAHRIPEVINFLENKSEIFAVLPPIESNLSVTDLILFLATAGSINSPKMVQILKNGKNQGIETVPLKGLDVGWGDLAVVDLSRELGHEFTPNDFEGFCENVYSYIQQLKRSHNIFKDKSTILLKEEAAEVGDPTSFGTFKAELDRIIHIPEMKEFFEQNRMALTSICNSLQTAKVGGEGLFLTQLSGYFMGFMQQKEAMKKYFGGGQM